MFPSKSVFSKPSMFSFFMHIGYLCNLRGGRKCTDEALSLIMLNALVNLAELLGEVVKNQGYHLMRHDICLGDGLP
jgi:hypothetical protein